MDAAGRTGAGDGDGGGCGGGGGGGGGDRGGGVLLARPAKPAGWRARYAGRLLACRMGGCPEGHCDTRSRIMHDRILSMRRERERYSAVGTENEEEEEEEENEEEERKRRRRKRRGRRWRRRPSPPSLVDVRSSERSNRTLTRN
ncbi:hypothetical protein V1478_011608 [Vespula squamosa]|uniref:Uncharacterized protein n=1 Tax=Vespula squamosa TaxID=30214 RepID=A0ABD2AEY5_VESSQ